MPLGLAEELPGVFAGYLSTWLTKIAFFFLLFFSPFCVRARIITLDYP